MWMATQDLLRRPRIPSTRNQIVDQHGFDGSSKGVRALLCKRRPTRVAAGALLSVAADRLFRRVRTPNARSPG